MTLSLQHCLSAALMAGGITVMGLAQAPAPSATVIAERIVIDAVPVPLNPQNPSATTAGDFTYAGGLMLSSRDTDRLHEFSDLVVRDNRTITAVGDAGVLLDARLVLDASNTLVGLADAALTSLTDENGRPLTGDEADAEGLASLANGDLLVSFEKHPRILRYPQGGGRPRAMPSPQATWPRNGGMEALTVDPEADGVYRVGAEESGETWTCRVTASCSTAQTVDKPGEFGLVAMNLLPGGLTAYLLRAYDPDRGSRITLRVQRDATVIAQINLARPMTVDNFEGVASVPGADGGRRFYLISDDNRAPDQRTLLFAFDWRPR